MADSPKKRLRRGVIGGRELVLGTGGGTKTTIGGMVFKKKKSRSVVQRATFDHGGSFKVILGIRIQWREVEIGGNDSGKLTLSFVRTEIVR